MNTDNTTSGRSETSGYSLGQISVADPSSLGRTVAGTAIGNFTEWYDFGVYSYIVSIISKVFFPHSSLATLATFAGLAVSFVIRPIGGIFWGLMGDRLGRRGVLALTVLLMATGTFLVGVLPSYASIGLWAPVLLFIFRGIQGFSTGGEYVGAMTFLAEHAPDRRRGHICSFLPMGTLSGYILGAMVVIVFQAVLSQEAMMSWGWRVPFLIAFPLGLVGLYLRLRLEETPAYEKQEDTDKMGNKSGFAQIRDTVLRQWPWLLVCAGLTLAFNVTNYMLTGFYPDYLPKVMEIGKTPALIVIVIVMAIVAIFVTFLGRLSDRIGRRPILAAGCVFLIVLSMPMVWFSLNLHGYAAAFLGTLPQGLMLVCFMSSVPSTLPALFPTNVRYGATSIGFNLSISAFGGTTPLIASALVESTGDHYMPAYMLIAAGILGAIAVYYTPETAGKSLLGSTPTAASEEEAREIADSK